MISLLVVGFLLGVVVDSFFEWTLHRYVMHRPVKVFGYTLKYAYDAHAKVHHKVFGWDETYHLINPEVQNKWKIPMAWWNGIVLVSLCQYPFLIVCLCFGHWWLLLGSGIAGILYYATYERLHWCMHLPRGRIVERNGIFFWLNEHHLIHHRHMSKNFNVVLPLADLCFGTLMLRSEAD